MSEDKLTPKNPTLPDAAVGLVALLSIDEGIHIVDISGKTIFYNEVMGKIEGLDPVNVLGRPLPEVFAGLSPENSTLLRVLKSREAIHDVVQTYTAPNGNKLTTINSTIPILIDGKCVAAMEVAKTLSRVRRLSEQASASHQPVATRKRAVVTEDENGTIYSLVDILGESEPLVRAKAIAKTVAAYDLPVMIYGETGAGKELFAQSIHNASRRRQGQFLAINCSALPESLIESTLFGNVKGSFTGALNHEGLFKQADGGTLFLDEINSASMALQGKLLRVLEEKAIRRVGANTLTPVDVRILTSCNVDPAEAIRSGRLRSDLFYRLSVYTLRVPPLRERRQDIPGLVHACASRAAQSMEVETPELSDEVMNAFMTYTWPGNVRELRNAVQSIVGLCPGVKVIGLQDLPDFVRQSFGTAEPADASPYDAVTTSNGNGHGKTLEEALAEAEANLIERALKEHNGKVAGAAKALGLTRQALHYRMMKRRIKPQ